jgi:MscS family membrane protein
MNGFITFIQENQYDLVRSLIILFIVIIFRKVILKCVELILKKLVKDISYKDVLSSKLKPSFELFVVALGIYLALITLPLSVILKGILTNAIKTLLVLSAGLYLIRIEKIYIVLIERLLNSGQDSKNTLVIQFFTKVIKFFIVILTLVIAISDYYDVNGFIAGLGIAGLAVAMAAKDTLANIFAGFTLIIDKPFEVGDRVVCNSLDGIIEDINFRSTKLRTFGNEVIIIPNTFLATNPIYNYSMRDSRRVELNIKIDADTKATSIDLLKEEIRNILDSNEDILSSFDIALTDINQLGINLMVVYYTNTDDWNKYIVIRDKINSQINAAIEDKVKLTKFSL